MPRIVKIVKGSENPEIAKARYREWRQTELDPCSATRGEIEERNQQRKAWNAKPEDERKEINEKRIAAGRRPIHWPLRLLILFSNQCNLAKRACRMTRLERRKLGADFSAKINRVGSREHQDVQHMLGAWDTGESRRRKQRRINRVHRIAAKIMARRESMLEAGGFELKEHYPATFGPGCGRWSKSDDVVGCQAWFDHERAAACAHAFDGETQRETWENVETLLPVFYEFARQSPKVLQWAVMVEIVARWRERVVEPNQEKFEAQRAWPMHPLEEHERKFHDEMRGRIGGFSDGLAALAEYLVKDTPFALIPLVDRKRAARHVLRCNQSHRHSGPWSSDAGDVADPWAAKLVTRDEARLAMLEEATQKARILYDARLVFGEGCDRGTEKKVFTIPAASLALNTRDGKVEGAAVNIHDGIDFNGALNATTEDHLLGKRSLKTILPQRVIEDDGSEVLAIRVVWKDTSNSDLLEQIKELLARLRPRTPEKGEAPNCWPMKDFPERKGSGSGKDLGDYKAALESLIKLRNKKAVEVLEAQFQRFTIRDAKDKRERDKIAEKLRAMKMDSERMALRSRQRDLATAFFKFVMGGGCPWWDSAQKGKAIKSK